MKTNKNEEKKCEQVCHGIHINHGEHCQKEQPEQKEIDFWGCGSCKSYGTKGVEHVCVAGTGHPTPPQELRQKTFYEARKYQIFETIRYNLDLLEKTGNDGTKLKEIILNNVKLYARYCQESIEQKTREKERERCSEIGNELMPEIVRDGNWGHTYSQGYKDGYEAAILDFQRQILNPNHHE